jgi:hypothetical protein
MDEAAGRVADWKLEVDGFDGIEGGLVATYRQARKTMGATYDSALRGALLCQVLVLIAAVLGYFIGEPIRRLKASLFSREGNSTSASTRPSRSPRNTLSSIFWPPSSI